ncbi:MAG: hypothetical protein GX134_14790 [candidate division WS1 bacterium]|jgi:hypothetical protein|nr:hypothetical protein [candidate division WS1 bacterium]
MRSGKLHVVMACASLLLVSAAIAGPLVLDPEPGVAVPYRFQSTLQGNIILPGVGSQPLSLVAEGRYTDKVEQVGPDGERLLSRALRLLQVGESADSLKPDPSVAQSEPLPYIRDLRGRLLAIGDVAAHELPPLPLDPVSQQVDPLFLTFFQQIVIPYPQGDLAVGMEWDAGPDLRIMKGITAIQAPSKVVEITTGNPSFAVIESVVSLMSESEEQVSIPQAQGMSLKIRYGAEIKVKQWSAVANGLVARTESSGKARVDIGMGNGGASATLNVDTLECLVTYDEEGGQ